MRDSARAREAAIAAAIRKVFIAHLQSGSTVARERDQPVRDQPTWALVVFSVGSGGSSGAGFGSGHTMSVAGQPAITSPSPPGGATDGEPPAARNRHSNRTEGFSADCMAASPSAVDEEAG